jgi:hypothetical protein
MQVLTARRVVVTKKSFSVAYKALPQQIPQQHSGNFIANGSSPHFFKAKNPLCGIVPQRKKSSIF